MRLKEIIAHITKRELIGPKNIKSGKFIFCYTTQGTFLIKQQAEKVYKLFEEKPGKTFSYIHPCFRYIGIYDTNIYKILSQIKMALIGDFKKSFSIPVSISFH